MRAMIVPASSTGLGAALMVRSNVRRQLFCMTAGFLVQGLDVLASYLAPLSFTSPPLAGVAAPHHPMCLYLFQITEKF